MSPKHEMQPDNESLQAELDSILSVPLTPENINYYADTALAGLVDLAELAQANFRNVTTELFATQKEFEDAAFFHYGLDNIEHILDHVANKSDELHALDELIEKITIEQSVLVPPDSGHINQPGENPESYEQARSVPRLKTLLFVLANEFEIDVHDREAAKITTGVLNTSMVRGESYNLIDVPSLERTILLCDEVGNVTFVFDHEAMDKLAITSEDLSSLTKSDIKDLLSECPELGQSIIYHESTYVNRLIETLQDVEATESMKAISTEYLRPVAKAPEDVLSITGLSKKWDIDSSTIRSVFAELGDELGEVTSYLFRSKTAPGFNSEQQAIIYSQLERQGAFAESAPEGVLSLKNLREQWGVGSKTIKSTVVGLEDELADAKMYRFSGVSTRGYNLQQQAIIYSQLERQGAFAESAPEDTLSLRGLCMGWEIDSKTVASIIDELGDELGEVMFYRFHTKLVPGYNLQQQAIIYSQLERQGALAESAPEDVASSSSLRNEWGVDYETVERAITTLGDELGEVRVYRFGTVSTRGYAPEQQAIIYAQLERQGIFAGPAPEGTLSVRRICKSLGLDRKTVMPAITALGDELGEAVVYRFHSKTAVGYSPAQQELIRKKLEEAGKLKKDSSKNL